MRTKLRPRDSDWFVGLDLGQAHQPTAVAVLEKAYAADARWPHDETWAYDVRHLERYTPGTPYSAVFARLRAMFAEETLAGSLLIVDETGVGQPVIALLRGSDIDASIRTVTITAGHKATCEDGTWMVPTKELVGVLQILFQGRRLRVALDLAESETLVRELTTFQAKVTIATEDTTLAWREGVNDDLVLALAVAAWQAERHVADGGVPCVLEWGRQPRRWW